jgi:uncharacterized membrane protein
MMTTGLTRFSCAAASAAVLALASCERPAVGEGPRAPKAASAGATADLDVGEPITARGTEPFWALHITEGRRLRLTRPDHPDLTAEAADAAMEADRAVWVTRTSDGRQMTVTVRLGACSDGMSDLRYPMTAEVVLPGERLGGCAAQTAELPREGS